MITDIITVIPMAIFFLSERFIKMNNRNMDSYFHEYLIPVCLYHSSLFISYSVILNHLV